MKAFSHPSKEKPTDIEAPLSHQTEVNDILKSLDDLLDSMRKNHSVISQMAESWGELSFWIKISVGLVAFGSFFVIGMLALNTLLIVTAFVCAALYTLISLGLDNHHATSKGEYDKLKSKILSLGSLLSLIIEKLNSTSLQLSTDVDRLNSLVDKTKVDFESEVSRLKQEVNRHSQNNDILGRMVKSITSHYTQTQESNKAFQDTLDQHLNDFINGKAGFFESLGNMLELEKKLANLTAELIKSQDRYEALYPQYEELFKKNNDIAAQQQQKLDDLKKPTCSTGTQTNSAAFTTQLFRNVRAKDEYNSVASSQQTLRFQHT